MRPVCKVLVPPQWLSTVNISRANTSPANKHPTSPSEEIAIHFRKYIRSRVGEGCGGMFHCTLYLKNFGPPSLPHVSPHSPLGILFGHKYKWFGLFWCSHHRILLNFLAKSVDAKKKLLNLFFSTTISIFLRYLKCFSRPRLYDKPEEKENRGICVKHPQNSCENKLFDKLTQTVRNFQKHACRQH